MLELIVDPQVAAQAPWRAELRREVSRMLKAAARTEAAIVAASFADSLAATPEPSRRAGGRATPSPAARAGRKPATPARRRPAKLVAPAPLELVASLRLTDDATIRELNREFRQKDKATDVLAFAQREGPWAGVGHELLGDIVISLATARRQARRKTPAGVHAEVRFLASHGLCHLLGYDHRDDEEERVMNARMAALLEQATRRGPVRAA
jgi:rRNA maturation RNase YbeY